jgi:hypothetical protein
MILAPDGSLGGDIGNRRVVRHLYALVVQPDAVGLRVLDEFGSMSALAEGQSERQAEVSAQINKELARL